MAVAAARAWARTPVAGLGAGAEPRRLAPSAGADSPVMAVAAARAWASRSGGRCGASAVSASARRIAADRGGGGQRLVQQVGR